MRFTRILAMCFLAMACCATAEDKPAAKPAAKKAGMSDAAYISKALSAAPSSVAKGAGVMKEDGGSMKTLRESKNGFTCMVALGSPMCADENSMAFFGAWMKHENPPQDKTGITYMLRGDNGASNTDPYAQAKTADNHWITTGSHIMVVGPAAKAMGLPDSADADPTKPYLMWANTPYAHAMIPISGGAAHSMAAMKSGMKDDMGAMKCGKK